MFILYTSAIMLVFFYIALPASFPSFHSSSCTYSRNRLFQALNPANTNMDIHIMAPTIHTLNRSGACPSASFSDPWYQMYTYVYTTRLTSHPMESMFIVNAETPAEFPAVMAAANSGRASNPFDVHASARSNRPRV
jgi:hypothetical protein